MSVDIETYSDVSIKEVGHFRYIDSPAFEVLLIACGNPDTKEVTETSIIEGEILSQETVANLFDENVKKHAFNASFEWYALSKFFNLTEEQRNLWLQQWECTQIHSAYLALPMSLDGVGAALNLPKDEAKDRQGKALIQLFCCPQTPAKSNGFRTRIYPHHSPDKWRLFKSYNKQDVVAEMAIEAILSAFPVPFDVFWDWRLNEIIVSRGVSIDSQLVNNANEMAQQEMSAVTSQLALLIGNNNPSDRNICLWLTSRLGQPITSLAKDKIAELKSMDLPDDVKKVLNLRSAKGKTSVTKYKTMTTAVCRDNTVKGTLKYYGSRTGRWSGKFIQPQNIPRVYIEDLDKARELLKNNDKQGLIDAFGNDILDTLSQLIRTAIIAKPGYILVDADFSAIEARVISWLADEEWKLNVFRTHGKIYEASASQMFNVPIEKIKKGNPEYALRAKGKIAELALGYQGGVPALIAMGADKMNLSNQELNDIVKRWRKSNKNIAALWDGFGEAAIQAVQTGKTISIKKIYFKREVKNGLDYLTVTLPSGRNLYYAQPKVIPGKFGDQIEFIGVTDQNHWKPITTYGGKITENIVQAIARDILAEKIRLLEASGIKTVFHVHDEVITEWPIGQESLATVCDEMKQPVSFAPDLPLNAEGYVSMYFKKD
ncbi:MAG: DNA polymerase [Huintestinicola sp.]